jgi:hypothetical protein
MQGFSRGAISKMAPLFMALAFAAISGCSSEPAQPQVEWRSNDFVGVWKAPGNGQFTLDADGKYTTAAVPVKVIPFDSATGSQSGTWDLRSDGVDTNVDLIPGPTPTSPYNIEHGSLIAYGTAKKFILCFMSGDDSKPLGVCDITYTR